MPSDLTLSVVLRQLLPNGSPYISLSFWSLHGLYSGHLLSQIVISHLSSSLHLTGSWLVSDCVRLRAHHWSHLLYLRFHGSLRDFSHRVISLHLGWQTQSFLFLLFLLYCFLSPLMLLDKFQELLWIFVHVRVIVETSME